MIDSSEHTESEVQETIKLIKENKEKFEKSNVNFLKLNFHKGIGWANRMLFELEVREVISSPDDKGWRKVL